MKENHTKEIKLHETMDAKTWTDAFMKLHPRGQQYLDWDDMIGWFSSAIMTGYDHARWKLEKKSNNFEELLEILKKINNKLNYNIGRKLSDEIEKAIEKSERDLSK